MYTISEVVELGNAQELIQGEKITSRFDDDEPNSLQAAEAFDE